MSKICRDTVSSELRTKQCRILSLLFYLLAEISTFYCVFVRERERGETMEQAECLCDPNNRL